MFVCRHVGVGGLFFKLSSFFCFFFFSFSLIFVNFLEFSWILFNFLCFSLFFLNFLWFSLIFFVFLWFSRLFVKPCGLRGTGKVSILYPCSLETVSGQFYHPRVSAVWPGPHALTTRVKRCEPANTGFRRCGPGHTNQGCLSSRVACVEVLFAQTASGRFYPPKNLKCVAWATRIDNEG